MTIKLDEEIYKINDYIRNERMYYLKLWYSIDEYKLYIKYLDKRDKNKLLTLCKCKGDLICPVCELIHFSEIFNKKS